MKTIVVITVLYVYLLTFTEVEAGKEWEKMTQRSSLKILKLATIGPVDDEQLVETIIQNLDGTLVSAHDAPLIHALAKGFGITFNIVKPKDNSVGFKKADGSYSGIMGMLVRGEADLVGFPLTLSQDRIDALNLTFPLHLSDVTFMTTKPEPYQSNVAIFGGFLFEIWVGIVLCYLFVPLLLYFLLKRRESYSTILMESIGYLLGQSYTLRIRQRNSGVLLLHWFLGVTVLATSYKAVILSVITVPRMVGIRDIKELSKAADEKSVMCMTYKGCTTDVWFDSNDERYKSIGECLKRSEIESLFYKEFFMYPYKKAFIATRLDISKFSRDYFLSEDSFSPTYHSILYSKQFCCPKKLESVVHRITAADLYLKLMRDRDFTAQLLLTKPKYDDYDGTQVKRLTLKDLTGGFLVLIIGYFCSFVIFIAEIIAKKTIHSNI